MKLQVPVLYSQRDPQWSSLLLGFNTDKRYTIGNYGCLMTCYSMYIAKKPNETNELLKTNNAFQNGGLFVWTKSTVMGLTQTYISPRYDGPVSSQGIQKIKDTIDAGFPVLCEVDFNPNTAGEEMHYVLVIGYEADSLFAADPWVGQIVNLDLYGGPQRAIIQFRVYDKVLDKEGISGDIQARADSFIAVCSALEVTATKDAALAKIAGIKEQVTELEDQNQQKDRIAAEQQLKINDLDKQAATMLEQNKQVKDQLSMMQNQVQSYQDVISKDEQTIKDLQDQILKLKNEAPVESLSGYELIIKGINRLFNRKG